MTNEDAPEVYSDGVQFAVSPFTVAMGFTIAAPGQGVQQPFKAATVRMSLEHAKVMAILLRRQLKQFEESMGQDIPLHPMLYTQLGISRQEDW